MEIFVTRIGVVSAIGLNVEENLASLISRQTGIKKSSQHNLMLGEVKLSDQSIIEKYNLPQKDYSRTALLGLLAGKEAWGKNKIDPTIRTGFISATSAGGMDKMEKYYTQFSQNENNSGTHPSLVFDNGGTTEDIAKELGLSGYIGTISTACSSGANAIMHGGRLISAGKLDRVLVGGSDPIVQYNRKGFSSLNIYDEELCKPFDDSRKGLNLGEGGGFLLLENEESISKTGNTPLCILSGWNNSTDAFHQTASSANGKGATLSMKRALEKAKISPDKISYINAHGTGTSNNDLSESTAIQNVFGEKIPPFSSTKGFTGHTLAAAGAIEAVFSVQAILSNAILPSLNFSTAMSETGFIPETTFRTDANVEHVLSNSFGFGGNCTSLIFSKIQ
jgi:3-oxoacyl-[acyl-carrier-protein] synthase-1